MGSKRSIKRLRVRAWRAAKKIVDCRDDRKYPGLCENFVSYLRAFFKSMGFYAKWMVTQNGKKLTEFDKKDVLAILEFILKAHDCYDFYIDETIRSLGKFENEPSYTLYYWSLVMDGCGDPAYLEPEEETPEDESDPIQIGDDFDVSPEERFLFPALEDAERIRITYSDNGFVGNEVLARCQR